jgi:DNA-directed RNA polymerase specialized sigma24 family protein
VAACGRLRRTTRAGGNLAVDDHPQCGHRRRPLSQGGALDPDLLTAKLVADQDPSAEPAERFATMDRIRGSLRQLPLGAEQTGRLDDFLRVDSQDIAERDGLPVGTVKSRVRRGLGALL